MKNYRWAGWMAVLLLAVVGARAGTNPKAKESYPTLGSIEVLDPLLNSILPAAAKIEKLADGFQWTEGPVWLRNGQALLFSDIPRNTVYKWKEGMGITEFLKPSGYTGSTPRAGEPGANGMAFDSNQRLVLCQHGDRRVARLERDGTFTVLTEYYKYRRFNSPNDLVYRRNGDLYFTDPPYGLEKGNDDPAKELVFSGVYRLRRDGQIDLLTRDLTFPNGLAFSPDEKTLYVAVSDPAKPVVMAYDVKQDGTIANGRVFFDASLLAKDRPGMPDGMKVDWKGNLFATGPGGVLVLSPKGKHLGTLMTGQPTANCAWGDNGSVLYITSNTSLLRVKTSTKGPGF